MPTDHAATQAVSVAGYVTVDLIDPDAGGRGAWRGKVIQREEGHNFLSKLWLERAKWEQRQLLGVFNPVKTANSLGESPQLMPVFPAEFCAAWNDATSEDSANEIAVQQSLVAYASRWPLGSVSGKRGLVNISESQLTDATAKWVFDWVTSQGNGTFQSVGFTRVDPGVNGGEPVVGLWPEDDFVTVTPASASAANQEGGLYWDGSLFYTVEWTGSGTNFRVASFAATGGTTTAVVTIPGTIAVSGYYVRGLCQSGTDWYIVGGSGQGFVYGTQPTVARMTAAGAQTWRRTETTGPGSGTNGWVYTDATVDGSSNLWVACTDGKMYRLSTSDGTIAATVTPAPTGLGALRGIAYDSADGNFWIHGNYGIAKVDSSGNAAGPVWGLGTSTGVSYMTDTTTSPYAGTIRWNAGLRRDSYRRYYLSETTSYLYDSGLPTSPTGVTSTGPGVASSTAGWFRAHLTMKSGTLWGGYAGSASINNATPIRGRNLASRIRLASPVTKTTANSLKITYTFNFS